MSVWKRQAGVFRQNVRQILDTTINEKVRAGTDGLGGENWGKDTSVYIEKFKINQRYELILAFYETV